MRIDRIKFATALAKKDINILRLAKLSGVSRVTISGVKHGKSCARTTAEKLAAVLGQEILEEEA
ncbi:helix-turn-helix domain-containing protein [uncultured Flavonifractor sp.]|uniref:helix-turn-helix domain-containing protein n=1 Tax=uncultured Flavonifractor sp. TaxID=1193534 RepID=UPI00262735F9|nr:helix-turn-helix domain-containing protein [uncultured Flavonifractor sp.]